MQILAGHRREATRGRLGDDVVARKDWSGSRAEEARGVEFVDAAEQVEMGQVGGVFESREGRVRT
jgi:hypothetical protein